MAVNELAILKIDTTSYSLVDYRISGLSDSTNTTSSTQVATSTAVKAAYDLAASKTDTKNTAGSTDTSSKIFLIGATSQAANPQTYSDDQVYVENGTLNGNNIIASNVVGVAQTAGTSGGISLYSGAGFVDSYGIKFRTTANSGKHGAVQSDWATYFTMDGADTRGWVFKHVNGNVASINGQGNAVFNGSVTIGGNEANTSGARMQYNATNKCIDFVFA